MGFTVYLIEMACNVATTSLFYDLLEPVSRSVSLLAAFLGLAGCAIKTVSRVLYLADDRKPEAGEGTRPDPSVEDDED